MQAKAAKLTQPSTHSVPGTVLSAHDKDSCILSFRNSNDDPNKNRDFSEEKSSLQGGTGEKISSFKLFFTESLFGARICARLSYVCYLI